MDMNCLVVDDNFLTLLGMSSVMHEHFPQWKIHQKHSLYEAEHFIKHNFDVYIDMVMIGLDHTDHVDQLVAFVQLLDRLSIKMLVVSGVTSTALVQRLQHNGCQGYVLKNGGLNDIVEAIDVISHGGKFVAPVLQNRSDLGIDTSYCSAIEALTDRQKDVIDLLLAGLSNKRIADHLDLSQGTVKNYMFDLMRLMKVSSRLELALKIREQGYRPRDMEILALKPGSDVVSNDIEEPTPHYSS